MLLNKKDVRREFKLIRIPKQKSVFEWDAKKGNNKIFIADADNFHTILLETSNPTSPPKSSIYVSSHTPGQVYSPEIPTQVTSSLTTFGTLSSNKKKTQSECQ